jgi:hypothetical protein
MRSFGIILLLCCFWETAYTQVTDSVVLAPVIVTTRAPRSRCKTSYNCWGKGLEIGRYVEVPKGNKPLWVQLFFEYRPFDSRGWKPRLSLQVYRIGANGPGERLGAPIVFEPMQEGKFSLVFSLDGMGVLPSDDAFIITIRSGEDSCGYLDKAGTYRGITEIPVGEGNSSGYIGKQVGLSIGHQRCNPPGIVWSVHPKLGTWHMTNGYTYQPWFEMYRE